MYANQPAAKIDTYWNFLKNLSGTEKLQLITRLSSSLLDNTSVPTNTAANFYGVWKDDDFIEITEWANGEGIDVRFEEGNSARTISLFYEELEAINYLSMALRYNQSNKD